MITDNHSTVPFIDAIKEYGTDKILLLDKGSLSTDKQAIKHYTSGGLVAIQNPTSAEADQMRALLGLQDYCMKADLSNVELLGIQKTSRGAEQIIIKAPTLPPKTSLSEVDIVDRAKSVVKMMSENHELEVLDTPTGTGDPVDLFNQAMLYTNRVQWCLPVRNSSGQLLNCYYQVIAKAQSVWVKDASGNEYDYYFIMQYCVFSPSPGYVSNDSDNQGWYVTYYNMNAYPVKFKGNADMYMAQNSPGTTEGQTSVTSSINETTGISIGFFGDQGTANFSASVTIGHSETYSIPDLSVENSSLSEGNNAEWSFEMPYAEGSDSLSQPVGMTRNTFQPINMMLWQAGSAIRSQVEKDKDSGMEFQYDFNMQYVFSYIDGGGREDKTYQPDMQSGSFTLPLPPKKKAP